MVSYSHALALVEAHGETSAVAHLVPLTVDRLIYLKHRRHRAWRGPFPEGTIVAVCSEQANRQQGGGHHPADFCLGANLARAELEEALAFLAPRTPRLRADGPAELGSVERIYGVNALPLTWKT